MHLLTLFLSPTLFCRGRDGRHEPPRHPLSARGTRQTNKNNQVHTERDSTHLQGIQTGSWASLLLDPDNYGFGKEGKLSEEFIAVDLSGWCGRKCGSATVMGPDSWGKR
jgi:hypothetical protein